MTTQRTPHETTAPITRSSTRRPGHRWLSRLGALTATVGLALSMQAAASGPAAATAGGPSTVAAQETAAVTGHVDAAEAVNVRRGPHSGYYGTNGSLADGTAVTASCKTFGESVTGPQGTTSFWYRIGQRQYISGAYLDVQAKPKNCNETRTNDYPYAGQCPPTGSPIGSPNRDEWNYTKGQCTSFVAFRADQRLGVDASGLGDARDWDNGQFPSGTTPMVGAVAVSETGTYGHVAYVSLVNSDGSFTVEEYNRDGTCQYTVRSGLTLENSEFSSFAYL